MKRFLTQDAVPLKMNKVQLESKKRLEKAITEELIRLVPRESCICGSTDYQKIAHIDRFGLDFPSYLCKQCGVIFTNPHIADESLALYYQKYYHPLTFGTYKPLKYLFSKGQGKKIFSRTQQYLQNSQIRILEVGAGSGSNLSEFKTAANKKGIKVQECGLEFNDRYVESGREKGLNLLSATLEEFVVAGGDPYDLIILSHVLEHFTDIRGPMSLLQRLSHAKTVFYIEVPGVLDLKTRYVYNCDFLCYLTHAHMFNFSLKSLTSTLNTFGLELITGNEKIESLFRIGEETPMPPGTNRNYEEIIVYLNDLEDNLPFYQSRNPSYSLFGRMKRKVRTITEYFMEKM